MYTEWMLFDPETEKMRSCRAKDQKDAIRKAISKNIIPGKTDDVRPLVPHAKSNNTLMSPEEFREFMNSLSS